MYEEFYGLSGRPFRLSPDPQCFFGSKVHKRVRAYLEYGLQQREGFIVITGDAGTGKTTLLQSLLATPDERDLVAAQLLSTNVGVADLLPLVCMAFGLGDGSPGKAQQLAQLEQFLRQTSDEGRQALLLVDEAQNLSIEAVEELRMLSNLQAADGQLLQIVFVGQTEFRHTLRSDRMQQFRQRILATHHLGPMDVPDTRAYVEFRLARVGWRNDPRFAESIWNGVHRYTGGVPRKINSFFDRLLLMGFLEERHELGPEQARAVVAELEQDFGTGSDTGSKEGNGSGNTGQSGDPGALQDELRRIDKRLYEIQRVLVGNYKLGRRILATVDASTPPAADDDQHSPGQRGLRTP